MDFIGAKAAFFCGATVLTYLRDDRPGLSWAGLWDLPGGGREADESPEACLLREFHEEFGLSLPPDRLLWQRVFPAMADPGRSSVFFAGHLTRAEIGSIRFGDEGQGWEMMPVTRFLSHPSAMPDLQRRTAIAWAELAALPGPDHA
ncbi:MAG TPA: NUDIX hydrolase [Tabrizicola sp.]|nr:NUDIX hydrolase [Tabrizicola sp.]